MTTIVTQQDIQWLENCSLPKWPQMRVWGSAISPAQAKDIILRTDSFFSNISEYSGGNNKKWASWARQELGFEHLVKDESSTGWRRQHAIQQKLQEAIGFVDTEYVKNNWAASSYIFGPHGWCHPDGTIWFEDNVGKYPSAREIFEEWQALVTAFPFLDLTVTLFSGEQSEDDTVPVISFRVENGAVSLLDKAVEPAERLVPERDQTALIQRVVMGGAEQGLDNQWIRDFGERIRPLIAQFEAEVDEELKQD